MKNIKFERQTKPYSTGRKWKYICIYMHSCKCTEGTNLYFLLSFHHTAIVHLIPPQTAFPSPCQGHGKVVFMLNRFVFKELVGYIFSWPYFSISLLVESFYGAICLQKHFRNKIYPFYINPCICSINFDRTWIIIDTSLPL
jgi:hypothetical protein